MTLVKLISLGLVIIGVFGLNLMGVGNSVGNEFLSKRKGASFLG